MNLPKKQNLVYVRIAGIEEAALGHTYNSSTTFFMAITEVREVIFILNLYIFSLHNAK
jgi:hypothetical protein